MKHHYQFLVVRVFCDLFKNSRSPRGLKTLRRVRAWSTTAFFHTGCVTHLDPFVPVLRGSPGLHIPVGAPCGASATLRRLPFSAGLVVGHVSTVCPGPPCCVDAAAGPLLLGLPESRFPPENPPGCRCRCLCCGKGPRTSLAPPLLQGWSPSRLCPACPVPCPRVPDFAALPAFPRRHERCDVST